VSRTIVFRAIFAVLIALYPFIVYFGIKILPPGLIGLVLALLLLARFGIVRPTERSTALPVGAILFAFAVASALVGSAQLLLYYPVVVNAVLFFLFAGSLRTKEPLLLRIVRARGTAIGGLGVTYLTRLTAVWAAFFVVNGMIAVWTTTADLEVWTLYNGLIAYLIIAALILGELMFRRHYKRHHNVSSE
jgi:uncharacterized membrane protein